MPPEENGRIADQKSRTQATWRWSSAASSQAPLDVEHELGLAVADRGRVGRDAGRRPPRCITSIADCGEVIALACSTIVASAAAGSASRYSDFQYYRRPTALTNR